MKRLTYLSVAALAVLGTPCLDLLVTSGPAAACGSDTITWQDGQSVGDHNDGNIWLFIASDKTEVFWKGENGYVMQSVKGRWNTGQESDAPPPVPNNGGMSAGPQGTYFVWVQATASNCSSSPSTTQPAPTTTAPKPPPTTAPPATQSPATTAVTSKPTTSTSTTALVTLPTTTPTSEPPAPLQAVKKAASAAHNNHHLTWLWWLLMLVVILILCLLGYFFLWRFRRGQAN